MKVCMAQIEVTSCRPNLNFERMSKAIASAKSEHADTIVFPELCLSGYLIGDTWEEQSFLSDLLYYGEQICTLAKDIIIVFGNIAVDKAKTNNDGRPRKYNALYCAQNGKFMLFPGGKPYYIKTLLPNYREFEEPRHFCDSERMVAEEKGFSVNYKHLYFIPRNINGVSAGLCTCEDAWSSQNYPTDPVSEYVNNDAELIINISASPYTLGKNRLRNKVFGLEQAKKHNVPLIYVNQTGLQNNGKTLFTFDGSSTAYNKNGEIVAQAPMFKEHLLYIEYKNGDILPGELALLPSSDIEEIEQSLLYGIDKYLRACGTNKVVVGLSGGIDSAVTAALYAKIVGPENLLLVNMPSKYNSATTKNIAEKIAKNIGCYYTSIGIEESVELTTKQIQRAPIFKGAEYLSKQSLNLTPFHLENVQARDRSSRILAALSSAWGGVFTCNGNKSELSVAYCTMLGDLSGYLAAIGDLWKEQVYELGRHINKTYPVLPEEVFTVVPSAELSSEQNVDEGKGDPLVYWYHDRLFQSWMQWWFRCTPEENLEWYSNGTINQKLSISAGQDVYKLFSTKEVFCNDLEHWYKLFKGMGVAKRVQAPPVLALSRRSYGFDFRETLNGCYFTRRYYELKLGKQ